MHFFQNTVGRKIVIAVTGQIMLVFVILHLLGNPLNPYQINPPDIGSLKHLLRFVLFLSFVFHAFFGIQVAVENRAAKPQTYVVRKRLHTNFAAENMIWTGVLTAAFIIYHLIWFSLPDRSGSFWKVYAVAFIYFIGLLALLLHLYHGIASFFQTIGCNNERTITNVEMVGKGTAVMLFAGYVYIMLLNW